MNDAQTKPPATELILASASPRRRALLARLPIRFRVIPCAREEPPLDTHDVDDPIAVACSIAAFKANCVAQDHPERWVLGADTLVACAGEMLGKPRDVDDARRMLICQAKHPCLVITGLALLRRDTNPKELLASASTTVWMHDDPVAREAYLRSDDWRDKAGAYGIQSTGDALVAKIEGSFSNVVGLPLRRTAELLLNASLLSENAVSQLAD